MGSTMPELESLAQEAGGGLQLAIATTFSVAGSVITEDEAVDFVIKQEPQEIVPEVMDQHHELFNDDPMDEDMHHEALPAPEEISAVILQRAVSPPRYADPSGEISEELMSYYKDKYELKDLSIHLEDCDKIWKTLQLIKHMQDPSDDNSLNQSIPPKNIFDNEPKLPGLAMAYQPTLGNDNKALPDFRFSVKSKKRLYHCVTCGKEFIDSQHLRQHATEEHGIYVNPKRVYKAKAEPVSRVSPIIPDIVKSKLIEKTESEVVPPMTASIMVTEKMQQTKEVQESKIIEDSVNSKVIEPTESRSKTLKNTSSKERYKCFLCKRVTNGIYNHLKSYHKITGCVESILAQCRIMNETTTVTQESNPINLPVIQEKSDEILTKVQEKVVPKTQEVHISETTTVTMRKRKRNMPRWTIQKKKFRPNNYTNMNDTNVVSKGPFKCLICLGIYKTTKSFGYHRKIHRMRGETVENFDPSKSRFLNSPLCSAKSPQSQAEIVTNKKDVVNTKSQTSLMNYISYTKLPETKNEETDRRTCECGRTFRNCHTLFIHEEKCKGSKNQNHINDSDSGIGISIKIKKNKNDSYEVVPSNSLIGENFKDSKTCKDSDASSNDSGLALVDYHRRKVNPTLTSSKYSTDHSVLRIQVAEDDEEVDIEDENSNHSSLSRDNNITIDNYDQTNGVIKLPTALRAEKRNKQTIITGAKLPIKKNHAVPSLTILCKQVLTKEKQEPEKEVTVYKCQTCSLYFQSKAELMDHASLTNHNTKSHCPCGKKFKNLKFFNMHIRRYHPLLLTCSYCMTNFDRIEKYTEHKCEVTEGKLFIEPIIQTECQRCKVLVDLGEPFDKHMKIHYSDSPNDYQCFKCELKFDNIHQRKAHFSKEHGFSLCKICGKLMHIDHLLKHEAYHDGLGHPCHLCRKAFTQKALLKKHVQGIHDPVVNKTVNCIVCYKAIKLRYLKKHMSFHLHTEICRKCNKCYRSDDKKNLEDHVAVDHPNDYPTLKCDICDVSFISDKRYEEHQQSGSCKPNVNNAQSLVQNSASE